MPQRRGLAALLLALSAYFVLTRRRKNHRPEDHGSWDPVPRPRP